MEPKPSEDVDDIELNLQKAYLTILNYVQIASPELLDQMPKLDEINPEDDIISLMSEAYQNMTLILQNEQEALIKNEERAQYEMEDLRGYGKELNLRLNELQEHGQTLDEKVQEKNQMDQEINNFSPFKHLFANPVYQPVLETIDIENPTEDDLEKLRLLIENRQLELEDELVQRENQEIKKSELSDEVIRLEREIQLLEDAKHKATMEFRDLVQSIEEFEHQQEYTHQQRNYLKGDFQKLARKNESNFNKYQQMLRVEEQLNADTDALDDEMNHLRKENKFLDTGETKVEHLKKGLEEQEEINRLLREKLASLTKKVGQIESEARRSKHLLNHFQADLEKEGLDYELDNSFKIDVTVGERDSTYQPRIKMNEKSVSIAKMRMTENQEIIERLEANADLLSQKIIEETDFQEEFVKESMSFSNNGGFAGQERDTYDDHEIRQALGQSGNDALGQNTEGNFIYTPVVTAVTERRERLGILDLGDNQNRLIEPQNTPMPNHTLKGLV